MRRAGPVMCPPIVRRAGVAVLGILMAVGGTALAAPAAAAPPAKSAVIVQLTPGSDAAAESRRAAANGGSVSHVYADAIRGFAGEFTPQAIAALQRNPRVTLVEADGIATAVGIQTNAVWGLDRIDERAYDPVDPSYTYGSTGSGVTAYIIDTGVAPHAEFGTRLKAGYSAIRGSKTTADCNGHGTHVAGTVAGTTYGVAKQAAVVPVRVLDCAGNGSWSGVISGIDWAIKNHATGVPAVANMSLGGPANSSVDLAVANLVKDGVSVAVAAGNDNKNAAGYSPARVATAITVAATDNTDTRAYFSNYGANVDLFAPGVNITSAWLSGGVKAISGTSMAAPHVAGAAALLLSKDAVTRAYSPAKVESTLVVAATTGLVTDPKDSPNRLLYVGP
jgi:subtilisin family serine protease